MSQTTTQSVVELVPHISRDQVEVQPEWNVDSHSQRAIKRTGTAIIFTAITCVTGISSLLAGLVTVAIPRIAIDLNLATSLLLW